MNQPVHNTVPAAPANHVLPATTPGVNSFDFVKADRIHVKNGSLFIDGYLVLHPHELAPENETKLKQKLAITYSVNNPSFYESKDRLAVALQLGQVLPVSLESDRSKLQTEIKRYNERVDSGTDAALTRQLNDKQQPFAALVRDTMAKPQRDPIGIELLKNGLNLYLLMREKMTAMGYRNGLASYVSKSQTPDQVLTDLGDKIGVTPLQVRDAALKGGIDGVGQLLSLDPAYVKDVKAFVEYDATKEFSLNAIEHWHQGRHLLGVSAPIPQKIAAGMTARIEKTLVNARERVHHFYEVPQPIKHEEAMVAQAMNVLEPIQRALMFKLGYEVCYTPDNLADGIAFYPNVYGLHRKAANDLHSAQGTYRIYFSGHGDMKAAWRTLAHESAHLLNPEQFSADEVKTMDALADSDKMRFAKLTSLMDAHFTEFDRLVRGFQTVAPSDQAAYLAEAKKWSEKAGGIDLSPVIPYLKSGQDFLFLVKHANDTLQDEGARYAKSGYNSPQERIREVVSRFAELKQVEYAGQPQLLHFVAPGLDQLWEAHYLPHLKRVYQALEQTSAQKITPPLHEVAAVPVVANDAAILPKLEQRPNPEPVQPVPGAPVATAPGMTTPVATPDKAVPQPAAAAAPPIETTEPVAPTPVASVTTPPAAPTPVALTPALGMAIAASKAPEVQVSETTHAGMMDARSVAAMSALTAMGITAQR